MSYRLAVLSLHTSPLAQPGSGDGGGMNVYVKELCGSLARQGVDVRIYTRRTDASTPAVSTLEPGLEVVQVDAGPHRLAKEDLPAVLGAFTEAVHGELLAHPADALHAHYWLSAEVAHQLKHRFDLPLLTTFHTLGLVKAAAGDPEPVDRIESETRVIGCSDAVVANAEPERRALVELYGAYVERIEIVRPGVDRTIFSPGSMDGARRALGVGDEPRLLFVGRVQPLKGLDLAVEALARVADPRTRLVVIGGPSGAEGESYLARVLARAVELGVADRIEWVPPRPHHLLATWYRSADLVLVPSRSESFGLVALEAAACGVPVVAAAVGGLRTIVHHNRSGLLVEGRDPGDFAAAIDQVLGRAGLSESLRAGARRVGVDATWSAAADRLRSVIDTLVGSRLVTC